MVLGQQDVGFYQGLLGRLEQIDYNSIGDSVLGVVVEPYNYIIHDVSLSTKLLVIISAFIIYGVVLPFAIYTYRWIKAVCHPITFPYKHVLITGGDSGLGNALVQEVFMKGAYITMIGRDEEKLRKAAESIDVNNKKQPLINIIKTDITELKAIDVDKLIKQAEARFGQIEMVICCAAMNKPALFLQSDYQQYLHHMNLNFLGALKIIQPIAKHMHYRKQKGRIVLIGDPLVSHYVIPGMLPYACSKAALEQLAYQLKAELEPHDIKIHYFLPPPINFKSLKKMPH